MVLLFTILPALEIWVFFQIPMSLGAKLLVVLFTGVAGAALARAQGVRVIREIQEQLASGAMPTNELVEGGIVLFGGALLLTPGFITDAVGFACLLPPTRKLIAAGLKKYFAGRVKVAAASGFQSARFEMRSGGRIHRSAGVGPMPGASPRLEPKRAPAPDKVGRIDLGAHAQTRVQGPRTIDASFSVVDDDEA
ncbi:MAG: FxsA family protein [Deltaproteobacteria bacterium]|nr:FxsA family protein [Deltaproteobacteria bacterium]